MKFELDPQDLHEWQHKQTTQAVWKLICQNYKPIEALLICDLGKIEYHRGQAELLRDLAAFFEIKDGY